MRPTAISADRTRAVLTIAWDDGHQSELAFALLSAWCPCAVCTEERNNPDPLKVVQPKSADLESIQPVGNYAINIVWKNGCRYGIYTWEYLRELEAIQKSGRHA
ncbi:MAG: DUF971 domain-containing protein [Thermoflexales bacterium]|nr:DUF971 domain-containing protein [Thermoflexales bacterium]MCS7323904.1 DUF971 domain-containing protein [Thermoflexales bacterium]MCX7937867.1 DUF971 domain-containing protein [Thermoflexales bacterium]MDW8053752.1 DUF971 domain-containing protein [Anaerolineae bacterium]MDW8292992.1 DUF971 domain-containing protein [Anaerolineae bacterium]